MLGIMTSLKMRVSLLVVATALAAALVGALPATNAYADGGSDQRCSQRGGGGDDIKALINVSDNVILNCVVDDVNVEIEVGDVLSDNEVSILEKVIVEDVTICKATGKGNNACAVDIIDDVEVTVKALVVVVLKKITVLVKDIEILSKSY
jgi:hypothetical protein